MSMQSSEARQQKEGVRGVRGDAVWSTSREVLMVSAVRFLKWIPLTEVSTSMYMFFKSGPKDGAETPVAPGGWQGLHSSRGALLIDLVYVAAVRRLRVRSVVLYIL